LHRFNGGKKEVQGGKGRYREVQGGEKKEVQGGKGRYREVKNI
jgi:hypothetical protein